jgi:hypothetical protein
MVRALSQGAVALLAVGGGIAFALLAQQHGQSAEPPAWMSVLIGGAVTYFYASTSHINGQLAAINSISDTMAARRAAVTGQPVQDVHGTTPPPPAGT